MGIVSQLCQIFQRWLLSESDGHKVYWNILNISAASYFLLFSQCSLVLAGYGSGNLNLVVVLDLEGITQPIVSVDYFQAFSACSHAVKYGDKLIAVLVINI